MTERTGPTPNDPDFSHVISVHAVGISKQEGPAEKAEHHWIYPCDIQLYGLQQIVHASSTI